MLLHLYPKPTTVSIPKHSVTVPCHVTCLVVQYFILIKLHGRASSSSLFYEGKSSAMIFQVAYHAEYKINEMNKKTKGKFSNSNWAK